MARHTPYRKGRGRAIAFFQFTIGYYYLERSKINSQLSIYQLSLLRT